MTMLKIYHCYDCLSQLKTYGNPILELYESLCELYIANDCYLMIDIDREEHKGVQTMIKFLEKKGYIITTDASDIDQHILKFKPLGYIKGDDMHMFCPMKCKEEGENE